MLRTSYKAQTRFGKATMWTSSRKANTASPSRTVFFLAHIMRAASVIPHHAYTLKGKYNCRAK